MNVFSRKSWLAFALAFAMLLSGYAPSISTLAPWDIERADVYASFGSQPWIKGAISASGSEDTAIALTGITVGDPNTATLTVNITASSGSLWVTNSSSTSVTGANTSNLQLVGSITNLNNALATLTYQGAPNASGSATINMTVSDGGSTVSYRRHDSQYKYDGTTGKTYDYVAEFVKWADAVSGAKERSYAGQTGYLANINSATEQSFVFSNMPNFWFWLGLQDINVEGAYRWFEGPEAGQANAYSNMLAGEPNNGGYWFNSWPNDEDCIHTTGGGTTVQKWADGNCFNSTYYYLVEYDTQNAASNSIAVTLNAVADSPSDISLSAASVAENATANTTVGTLSATDGDAGDTATFSLVSGTGSTDNVAFNISGTSLRTNASFNFETKSSYSIRVRVTDSTSLTYEEAFTISVTNVNEAPTDISLTPSSIAENAGANGVVGTLSATDPDAGASFTYSLVSGAGSTDNAAFNISGTSLRANSSLDFETKSSYSVRVRVSDGSLTYEEPFTVSVTNVNEAPSDIALSSTSIAENAGANATVGTLSGTDVDAGSTFTFSLVAGTGGTDNGSFNISGTSLRATSSLDFEAKNSYSVRVQVSDGSLTYAEVFTISVTDVVENIAPTDIALSSTSIVENGGANDVVGTLSATDPDAGSTFTYSLVSGTGSTDNAAFNISGTSLRANASFDYETKSSYSVRIRVTDGELNYEEVFTITVTDVDDTAPTAPADLLFSNVTGTGVTLAWTPSTDNVGVTGYEIYNGTTLIATATESPYNVAGIASGVAHNLTVVAVDAAGNKSANSNSAAFTTPDVVAPSVPVNITDIESTPTSLRIQWDASTDNVGVNGYNVYRNRDFVGTIKGNRFTITGLKQNTPYSITVMAFDAAKNRSAQSVPVILRTADSQAPTVPGEISTSLITKDAAFFSWVASSDNVGVTAYNVFVNGTLVKTVPANRTELIGLSALTSYVVRLQAVDAAKNRSALSAPFTITTMEGVAPSVPTNLAASAITRTGFTVSWTASTDNVGVTGYQVLRNGVQVATVRNGLTSFAFASLALNESHQIAVRAIDAAGNQSALTEGISVSTTPVTDLVAPTAPADAASSNVTKTSVRISWTASTDNIAVTAYNIYRNGVYFGTASALSTFFTARNLTANTEHTFTLRAVDAERNLSAASNAVTVTTLP